MKNASFLVLICCLVAGCAKKEESSFAAPDAESVGATQSAEEDPRRFMAYEHSVALDVDEEQVSPIYKSIEAACLAAVAEQCVILQSNLQTGRHVSAEIKLRAKPEGVRRISAKLSTQGKVIRQSLEAEDLAGPLGDSAKKLKMLQDYRTQLEVLRGRANNDIESLIKINKELSETQSQIESISGEQAHLYNRVHTEILNISVSSRNDESFWRPIGSALGDFKARFADGISNVITALAYLIPWVTFFVLAWLGVRKSLSWRKRRAGK